MLLEGSCQQHFAVTASQPRTWFQVEVGANWQRSCGKTLEEELREP